MNTMQLNTTQLRPGMIVWVYGARLKLTEYIMDEAKAESYWPRQTGYSHLIRRGESEAVINDWIERERTIRSFKTEFLGNVEEDRPHNIPAAWLPDWTVQGNINAVWTVETE